MSLSIGIELEGVAVRRNASLIDFPVQTEQQMRLICDAFTSAGLQSRVYIPSTTRDSGPNYSGWNITIDGTISELTSESSTDSTVAYRSRFGFEVVSPVFYDTTGSEWRRMIIAGVEAIGDAVQWKANRSTGFHVHIGPGAPGTTFSLEDVKKIAIFCCRFEDAMDYWHPEHRRSDNDNIMSNRYNDLLQYFTFYQIYGMIVTANTVDEVIKIVNYVPDEQAYDGYSDSRFFKVNFTSLAKHGTIEFRQHEGTTDPRRVIRWACKVLQLVTAARSASFEMLQAPGDTYEDLRLYVPHET